MDSTISLQRAVEVAEHNGWWRETTEGHGPELIVFDALTPDRLTGIRLTVEQVRLGWRAVARDGCGKQAIVRDRDRIQALKLALDNFLIGI